MERIFALVRWAGIGHVKAVFMCSFFILVPETSHSQDLRKANSQQRLLSGKGDGRRSGAHPSVNSMGTEVPADGTPPPLPSPSHLQH